MKLLPPVTTSDHLTEDSELHDGEESYKTQTVNNSTGQMSPVSWTNNCKKKTEQM